MPHSSHIDDFIALIVTANDDVAQCAALLGPSAVTPFARRTLIRTVFAYVETWMGVQRQLLLEQHDLGVIVLTAPELTLLRGESYELDDSGRLSPRPTRLPDGRRLVRFLLTTTSRAFDLRAAPDFSGHGWSSFCSAWKIRNRITNPTRVSALDVADTDLETTHQGYLWFCGVSTAITKQTTDILRTHIHSGV